MAIMFAFTGMLREIVCVDKAKNSDLKDLTLVIIFSKIIFHYK